MAAVDRAPMCTGGLLQRRRPANDLTNNSDRTIPNDVAFPRISTTDNAPTFPTPLSPLSSKRFDVHSHRRSVQRTDSEVLHDNYLDKLEVPTLDQISSIAQIQEEKERVVQQKYQYGGQANQQEEQAAERIQRTYRGHRARREMQGLTLDPTTRWIEALKTARYQNATKPGRRRLSDPGATSMDGRPSTRDASGSDSSTLIPNARKSVDARTNWHHVSAIASHAIGEMPQTSSSNRDRSGSSLNLQFEAGKPIGEEDDMAERAPSKQRKHKDKGTDSWAGKMMDLPYFLEMVDQKHRYGSNLRAYHELWMKTNTQQSYFWWLDFGDGKDVEHPNVSRKRLEREQVRYLSREERLNYLVHVDDQGRLIWAKNDDRITTSTAFRDSVNGIVSTESDAKAWREDEMKALQEGEEEGEERTSSDGWSAGSGSPTASPLASPDLNEAERRYPDPPDMREAKGTSKVKHVSAQAILNRLLRKTLVAQNTWIFAVDTNMNLYLGIKQSGSFQHSSFMRGSRLSAAGTIKIKDGQVRAINPLSGHYRPPAKAFRHFVHHMEATNVDMSRVSISKSYAILVGLEMYIRGKNRVGKAKKAIQHGAGMVMHPAKTQEAKEKEKDNSQSAQKEREIEREEKGSLSRVLEDAKNKVEVRWAALDANRTQDKTPADIQQVPQIPDPDEPHQEGLDKAYKEPDIVSMTTTTTQAPSGI